MSAGTASHRARPAPRRFHELVSRVTRVEVLGWAYVSDGEPHLKPLASIAVRPADGLPELLRIRAVRAAFACACMGGPTLALYAGREHLGNATVHHGASLRWPGWNSHAPLHDGRALASWLAAHGAPGLLAAMDAADDRRTQGDRDHARWRAAAPDALRPLSRTLGSWKPSPAAAARAVREVTRASRTRRAAVLSLLRWYASGVGPWSGCPAYESAPEPLLDLFDAREVVDALAGAEDDGALLGAARLFSMHWAETRRAEVAALPEGLLRRMRDAVSRSPRPDNLPWVESVAGLRVVTAAAPSGAVVVGEPEREGITHGPVATDGERVFAVAGGELLAFDPGSRSPTRVAAVSRVRDLTVDGEGNLLLAEDVAWNHGRVRRRTARGRGWTPVASGRWVAKTPVAWPRGVAWIEWRLGGAASSRGRVASFRVMRRDRGGPARLVAEAAGCWWLCTDGAWLYWVERDRRGRTSVECASCSTEEHGMVCELPEGTSGLDAHLRVEAGALFWVGPNRNSVWTAPPDGDVRQVLATDRRVLDVAVRAGAVYVIAATPRSGGFASFAVCRVGARGALVELHAFEGAGGAQTALLATRRGLVWVEAGRLWCLPWSRA